MKKQILTMFTGLLSALLSQAELPPMLRESSLSAAAIVFLSMGRRYKWKRMVLLDTTM